MTPEQHRDLAVEALARADDATNSAYRAEEVALATAHAVLGLLAAQINTDTAP